MEKQKRRKPISHSLRQIIFARDAYRCAYCFEEAVEFKLSRYGKSKRICILPYGKDGRQFQIDHIIPYSVCFENEINNMITSCATCNVKKSNRVYKISKNLPYIKLTKSR